MRLYADYPVRRARQIVVDVLAFGWLALSVAAGVAVHGLLSGVAVPLRRVGEVGRDLDASLSEAAGTASGLPVLGEQLGVPFREAASAGQRLQQAGDEGAALVDSLATVLGVLTAVALGVLVLLPWLVSRVRFVRRAAVARRMADDPASRDLLALRALTTQPEARLSAAVPLPAAAWRAGDSEAIRRLAALELARWGVRG